MSISAVTSDSSIKAKNTHNKRELKIQLVDSTKEYLVPLFESITGELNKLKEEYKKAIIQIRNIKKEKEKEKETDISKTNKENGDLKLEENFLPRAPIFNICNRDEEISYNFNYYSRNDDEYINAFSAKVNGFDLGFEESCVFELKSIIHGSGELINPSLIKPNSEDKGEIILSPVVEKTKEEYNVNSFSELKKTVDMIMSKVFKVSESMKLNNIQSNELFTKTEGTYSILNEKKKKLICDIVNTLGPKNTSKYFNLSIKSLTRWLKKGIERKKGGGRKIMDPIMETKLIEWYSKQKNLGLKITAKNIKQMARKLTPNKKFLASKGWFEKFKKKTNIHPDTHVKLVDRLDFEDKKEKSSSESNSY